MQNPAIRWQARESGGNSELLRARAAAAAEGAAAELTQPCDRVKPKG